MAATSGHGPVGDERHVGAGQGGSAQFGHRRLLGGMHGPFHDESFEVAPVRLQRVAGVVERRGDPGRLVDDDVEAGGHGPDLVGRDDVDVAGLDPGPGVVQVAVGQGPHGPGQVGQRALGQAVGGGGDLGRGVGDHAGQEQADGDGQDGDGHEDVLQGGDQGRVGVGHVAHGQQVADAVEGQHGQHGAGELEVKGPLDQLGAAVAVAPAPEGVGGGARVGQGQAGQHRRQAELLEAEHGGDAPAGRGQQPEPDRAPRGAVGTGQVRLLSPQQPHGHAGQRDADQVGEVGRRDDPDRVATEQERDGHARRSGPRPPRAHRGGSGGPGSGAAGRLRTAATASGPRR